MPNFTLAEKRIIYQILTLIMKADSILNPAEVEYLDKVFTDFEMDINEFDHMEEVTIEELSSDFSKFSGEKKEFAKKLFEEMSECDGYVDPREVDIINYFFKSE